MIGESLAHYRIVEKLGEGGMGVVYRARDSKLNRDVALKLLPETIANDPDCVARFRREAQVLAQLNHSGIAAIYGLEESGGLCAITMELALGFTLAERIALGPMPLDEALPIARQISEALAAAHERGVIHRDLKPANIKVDADGNAKLLDFGLAKALGFAAGEPVPDPTSSPAAPLLDKGKTLSGLILGTAGYMAPEQARGRVVDKRADIWAFGVVFFEMLTGKALFTGDSVAESLAAVLTKEPDFDSVPARVRPLLRRCLERDPKKRLRDIGDVWYGLDEASSARHAAAPARRWPWVAAAIFGVLAVAFAVLWIRGSSRRMPAARFTIQPEGDQASVGTFVSPDGRALLDQTQRLQVRLMDGVSWRVLPSTDGAQFPFWSPDSSSIGFFSEGQLKIMGRDGTSLRTLTGAPQPGGGSWHGGTRDGVILFASAGKLRTLDLASGRTRELPFQFPSEQPPSHPVFLPEGDGFVFLQGTALLRASLSSGSPPHQLLETPFAVNFARHPHNGKWYLFYGPGARTLLAVAINPRTGEPSGAPVKVLDDLAIDSGARIMGFGVGGDGTIFWLKLSAALPIWHMRWFDRSGNVLGTVGDAGIYVSLALSPDETRVAVRQGYPDEQIWLYGLDRGTGVRLSPYPGAAINPLWSPDSRYVYYTVMSEGRQTLVRQEAARDSRPEVMFHFTEEQYNPMLQDITSDGRSAVLLSAITRNGVRNAGAAIFRANLDAPSESGRLERLLAGFPEARVGMNARLTPDGHWLMFEAKDAAGSAYVCPFPPADAAPRLLPARYPSFPFFSRDGRTLFGFTIGGSLTAQSVAAGPDGFQLGDRSALFPLIRPGRQGSNLGAVTRDGSRILAISGDPSEETKMQVLTDWTTLLPAGTPRN
ncbi:MAG TPA: protein kinase [Verrucomicrobiae bacterium]|nr:protein kinase [Verrucomicrobiae bacterium]